MPVIIAVMEPITFEPNFYLKICDKGSTEPRAIVECQLTGTDKELDALNSLKNDPALDVTEISKEEYQNLLPRFTKLSIL